MAWVKRRDGLNDRRATAVSALVKASSELRLAELIASLSYALDITEGQPPGHCARACLIGMRIARSIGLPEEELRQVYYTLLLKDLGCSSTRRGSASSS